MKVKLFITSSLGLAALWLAAAYLHTVDVASYTPVVAKPVQLVDERPQAESSEGSLASVK